jgi:glucose-6-phosphate-specific signal transduction histidine kinase
VAGSPPSSTASTCPSTSTWWENGCRRRSSAYFVIAEALTNVVKHSQAAHAEVSASVRDGMLDIQVRDDGIGGADRDGHGLLGMKDRVAALGGRLEIASAPGRGTCVAATLPLADQATPKRSERRSEAQSLSSNLRVGF